MDRNIVMKPLIAAAAFVGTLACAPVQANDAAQNISVTRSGSQPSARGPSQFFTGAVRVDPLFPANAPSRVSGGLVTFEPGARSAWHTHPVGQVLIVTAGRGLVQRWGSPAAEILPGDVVRIRPGVKHWHGASPSTGMSHIAIQEALDGRNVDWLEQVSDEQYRQVKETR
jgi:quercetin dioxygenase-like cupin family protein